MQMKACQVGDGLYIIKSGWMRKVIVQRITKTQIQVSTKDGSIAKFNMFGKMIGEHDIWNPTRLCLPSSELDLQYFKQMTIRKIENDSGKINAFLTHSRLCKRDIDSLNKITDIINNLLKEIENA